MVETKNEARRPSPLGLLLALGAAGVALYVGAGVSAANVGVELTDFGFDAYTARRLPSFLPFLGVALWVIWRAAEPRKS